jgi:hypothetical protein
MFAVLGFRSLHIMCAVMLTPTPAYLQQIMSFSSHCSHQAAEIEAAEDFVETMAWLSFLDECDERARFNFEGMGKRWSARRAAGLIGKPNPAREIVATRTRSETLTNLSVTDLVTYTPRKFEEKPRKIGRMPGHVPTSRNVKTSHGINGPIQQPRKQN